MQDIVTLYGLSFIYVLCIVFERTSHRYIILGRTVQQVCNKISDDSTHYVSIRLITDSHSQSIDEFSTWKSPKRGSASGKFSCGGGLQGLGVRIELTRSITSLADQTCKKKK